MIRASDAMLRYALASGLAVPAPTIDVIMRESRRREQRPPERPAITQRQLQQLVRAHAELVRIVAPATPRTILLLSDERQSAMSLLGPVRLIRQMLVAVLILLAVFVGLSVTSYVNAEATSGDILRSTGVPLLVNELFYIAAGGLGAAFSALFTAYRYISDGTYDPKYESTYWLRFILGMMAGLLLPVLIPLGSSEEAFTKPLLALLGGFSAAVLYRILERLVGALESLVRGDSRELRVARRESDSARAAEQTGAELLAHVAELWRIEQQARAGGEPVMIADALGQVVRTLLPAAHPDADGDDDAGLADALPPAGRVRVGQAVIGDDDVR